MPLTPLDIHQKEFKKTFRGYSEEEVDAFLDEVVRDFEALLKESAGLREECRRLQAELDRYRQLEETLNRALIVAQETAEEVKANARREGEIIIREAREKAEGLLADAMARVKQAGQHLEALQREAYLFRVRMRSLLEAQLRVFSEGETGLQDAADARPVAARADEPHPGRPTEGGSAGGAPTHGESGDARAGGEVAATRQAEHTG